MTQGWSALPSKDVPHDVHCRQSPLYSNNSCSNDQWSISQHGTIDQTYLDPRQLQSGYGQAVDSNIGLGIQGLPSEDIRAANAVYRYTSPSSRNDFVHPKSNKRYISSRQSTPFDYSPTRDVAELETDAEEEDTVPTEPYNQLLHRCLLQQPNHELLLKDIYEWFKLNTDKGRDPRQKGWQNSIRHNLSMNPAFHKGSRSQPDASITNMWSLTDKAIAQGVEPTTRFRNHNRPFAKSKTFRANVPQRQLSGARGGRAARRSARLRTLATPDDSRSPSPAVGYYPAASAPMYGYAASIEHSVDHYDPWQTVYNGNGNSGPYYFNSAINNQTYVAPMQGSDVAYANQFDTSNDFNFTSNFTNNNPYPTPPDSGQAPSVPQFEPMEGQGTQFQPSEPLLAPTSLNMTSNVDHKVSGMHPDAVGEPLFTNSGDEDSSVEFEMPKTPQHGESIGWNDEGAGMFFNFDDTK